MLNHPLASPSTDTLACPARTAPDLPKLRGGLGSPPSDHNFVMLHAAFRGHRGILRGEDVAASMDEQRRGDFVSLARLIGSRRIFSFHWHDTFWVPMFQFEPHDLSLRHGPTQVLAELGTVFDGWTLASWYVQANDWLKGQRPLDLIDRHLSAVLQAARADRYIANG